MARTARASTRPGWRDRHGRGIRAAVTGPHLPMLRTRTDVFDQTVASTAGYLKDLWPNELAGVRFEVAALPPDPTSTGVVDRWLVIPSQRRIILFRLPIERMARLHRRDGLAAGAEPESLDKEFLRLWIAARCDPYKDPIPEIPPGTLLEFSGKYIALFEQVTGKRFDPPSLDRPVRERVAANLKKAFPEYFG